MIVDLQTRVTQGNWLLASIIGNICEKAKYLHPAASSLRAGGGKHCDSCLLHRGHVLTLYAISWRPVVS